jgi:hypothetical protein
MKGNITRRGKNSWRIKFDIEGTPGVRQTRFVTVRGTKKEAQIEAAKIIAATSKGEYVDSSKETVAEFVTRWLRDWTTGNTSNKTYSRYEELLRLHLVPEVGTKRIQRLRAIDLQSVYATLQREKALPPARCCISTGCSGTPHSGAWSTRTQPHWSTPRPCRMPRSTY